MFLVSNEEKKRVYMYSLLNESDSLRSMGPVEFDLGVHMSRDFGVSRLVYWADLYDEINNF